MASSVKVLCIAMVVIACAINVSGECCKSRGTTCGDCTDPTPYCGYGQCNAFGCDCTPVPPNGHVCRFGDCFRQKRSVEDLMATNGYGIVSLADKDMDGLLSMDEAAAYLAGDNNSGRSKRSLFEDLAAMDLNKDGMLSALEIDP